MSCWSAPMLTAAFMIMPLATAALPPLATSTTAHTHAALHRQLQSCPSTCQGNSCDYLSSNAQCSAGQACTCAILEAAFACDCTGCSCPNDPKPPSPLAPPTPPAAPPLPPHAPLPPATPPQPPRTPQPCPGTCQGYSCDQLSTPTSNCGSSSSPVTCTCALLEASFSCDCTGCSCPNDASPSPPSTPAPPAAPPLPPTSPSPPSLPASPLLPPHAPPPPLTQATCTSCTECGTGDACQGWCMDDSVCYDGSSSGPDGGTFCNAWIWATSDCPSPPPLVPLSSPPQPLASQPCPNTCGGTGHSCDWWSTSGTCGNSSSPVPCTCLRLEAQGCDCTGCSCPNDPKPPPPPSPPTPPAEPPLPPNSPLPVGSHFVTTPNSLVSALEDSTIDRIVVASGQYDFSNSMSCYTQTNFAPPALCINRSVIIEADVPGTVIINAQGSPTSHRMVLHIRVGFVNITGLNFTGGYNAGSHQERNVCSKLACVSHCDTPLVCVRQVVRAMLKSNIMGAASVRHEASLVRM